MPAPKGTRLRSRNGVWYIVWLGNSRGRSTGTRDRGVAEAVLAAFIQGRSEGVDTSPLTVATALDLYIEEHVMAARPDGSPVVMARARLWDTRKDGAATGAAALLAAHFGDVRVADITDDLVGLYIDRRTRGTLGRKVGAGTIRRELGCLIAAINHNLHANVRPRRLAPGDTPRIRLPEAPPPRDRWLPRQEADALLAAAQPRPEARLTRAYRFIAIALATGARRRSIEDLTWFQVDLERRIIHFNPAGRRQTKKRRAAVPISDALLPVLTRAWSERRSEHVLDHAGSIRTAFDSAVDRAGLKGVTRHALRHTFATWAAQAGVDMWMIAGVLGDTLATVTRTYAHHAPEHLRDAVNFGRGKEGR